MSSIGSNNSQDAMKMYIREEIVKDLENSLAMIGTSKYKYSKQLKIISFQLKIISFKKKVLRPVPSSLWDFCERYISEF